METKNKKSVSATSVTESYKNILSDIENKINTKNYVLKINNVESMGIELHAIQLNLSNISYSGLKKVAKRIATYKKKGTLRTIILLFHILNKMNLINDKIEVGMSKRETEIRLARARYVKLRAETEQARIFYKETKGDFYKQ